MQNKKSSQQLIDAWLNSNKVSDEHKELINKYSSAELNLAFNFEPLKFGTAGYRAKVGPGNKYLNEFTYAQIIVGYARYLNEIFKDLDNINKTVIVATDNRKYYKQNYQLAINILTHFGFNVIVPNNLEPLPTPILSYLIPKLNAIGGINITASHNPKEYNGIKFYNNLGSQLLPTEDEKVINNMLDPFEVLETEYKPNDSLVSYIDENYIDQYFQDIKAALKLNSSNDFNKKILFSSMHGATTKYMSNFLKSLGYDVVDFEPHNNIDSNFTNANVINPESEKAFKSLIEYANSNLIDLILAADPDGDRLGIAFKKNNKWNFINGNQAGIIQSYYLLKTKDIENKKPIIISTFVSNNFVDKIIKKYNGEVLRTNTGFKWIANQMNKLKDNEIFIDGFEEAIGALPSTINKDKDSFQVAGLMLEILRSYKDKNYDFYDILNFEIFNEFGVWFGQTVSFVIEDPNWKNVINDYLEHLKEFNYEKILNRKIKEIKFNELGNCLEFLLENDSYIKFRISGTEPKFKIYFNLYPNKNQETSFETLDLLKEEMNDIVEFFKQYLGII